MHLGSRSGFGRPSDLALALTVAALLSCNGGSGTFEPTDPPSGEAPPGATPGGPSATAPGGDDGQGTSPSSSKPKRDPGPPAVQLIGRFDERDPKGPKCGWPACRIIARFEGTSTLSATLGETPYNDGPSEWDLAIDGDWKPKMVLTPGVAEYTLAEGLDAGPHTVELYKRSEAQNGTTQFLGFDFHGGTLLSPPLRDERKLEIVGDSDVSGFGYEGAFLGGDCPGDDWAAKYENFHQAWGARLAEKLHAELNATVFSGKGFYYNIWRPDKETIGVLYPRSNPTDASSLWDITKFTPDVVVVSIGGNDYNIGQPVDNGPAPLDGFTQKARELTDTLRADYPNTHIFLMAYAVLTDAYPPGRGRRTNVETALHTVTNEHVAAGDKKVYFVAPPEAVESELTACDGHGGPEYHERIAVYMADAIRAKTGWK